MAERPTTESFRRSLRAYLVIVLVLAGIKVLLIALESGGAFRSPAQAAVFGWPFLLGYAALGSGAVWLVDRLGLPGTWDPAISFRDRFTAPLLIGVALGFLAVCVDLATNWTLLAARLMGQPSIHIAPPASAIIYPGGAAVVTIIYFLVPVPPLVWLATRVLGTGARDRAFLVIGALAALTEPVTQNMHFAAPVTTVGALMVSDYALNLAQVFTFRRAGFGPAVLVRVAFYLIWHVLWGLSGR